MSACGVILAAGPSSRFGGVKQLADLGGQPLIQWSIDSASAAPSLARVILVLGAHADEIEARLGHGRVETTRCGEWRSGLAASLRCGFALAADADWVVVLLGDEPGLPAAAIERVVAAAESAAPEVLAVRASWRGRPGHPVALSSRIAGSIARLAADRGARELIDRVARLEIECGDLGDPLDVDTRDELETARADIGEHQPRSPRAQ